MACAFILLVFSVAIFTYTGFGFGPDDANSHLLLLLRQIGNVFIIAGYLFVYYGFLYYRTKQNSFLTNSVSLLAGVIICAMFYPGWITIEYDHALKRWTGQMSYLITIMFIPLLLLFIIYWILPLLKYIRSDYKLTESTSGWFQLVGFIFIIVWAGSTAFSHIGIIGAIRGLIAYFPWLFWTLSIRSNPLILCHSKSKANWLLIMHESGIPLYYHAFSEHSPENIELASGMLSAIQQALDEILSSNTHLDSVNYQDKKLLFHQAKQITIILNCNSIDEVLIVALRIFSDVFEEEYKKELKEDITTNDRFKKSDKIITKIFNPLLMDIE